MSNVSAFSTKNAVAKKSRFTVRETLPTMEGTVGIGVDNAENAYLVHQVGRQMEAVALHAVATAVAGGAVPMAELVAAFKETGQLDALKEAVSKAK